MCGTTSSKHHLLVRYSLSTPNCSISRLLNATMYSKMKTEIFAKLFFTISVTGIFMYAVLAFYTFHNAFSTIFDIELPEAASRPKIKTDTYSFPQTDNELKYILIWTTSDFKENPLGEGQKPFVKNNCTYVNCFLSTDKDLLKSYERDFDVVIMDIGVLRQSRWKSMLPKRRASFQKFVFHSMRSADVAPICNIKADGYFNWTWTYRIQSDISTPFIEVKDLDGNVIAPKGNVKWADKTTLLSVRDIEPLKRKKKAVAWIPDSCESRTNRVQFIKSLQDALRDRSMELDIFGCFMGTLYNCPKGGCMKALENDYFFSLVFEDGFSEDYITTDVLKAYHHNVVPIVKSGADLSFFLPEGSYIDARSSSVEQLATLIDYSIKNPVIYQNFHKWKYNYRMDAVDHNKGICNLCAMVNDKVKFNTPTTYDRLREWWFPDLKEKCYPKGAEDMDTVISYLKKNKTMKTLV